MVKQDEAKIRMQEGTQDLQSTPTWIQTEWNLAAVHKPLQSIRKGPTIRPGLQELAARQSLCMSKCTRCWLTKPRTRLERPQMALAMSRAFSLCRNKVYDQVLAILIVLSFCPEYQFDRVCYRSSCAQA